MNARSIGVAALMMLIWACFGYAVTVWLDQAKRFCARHDKLAAECLAPHVVLAIGLTVILVVASSTLGWLALRK